MDVPERREQPLAPRVGDRERDDAATRLKEAVSQGMLTAEEFDERIGVVLTAKTVPDLEPALADLPAHPPAVPRPRGARKWLIAVMGGEEARGRWRPAEHTAAIALMGGVEIDLRHALLDTPEIVITAVVVMGGVDVIVPPGVRVEMSGFAFMGGRENRAEVPESLDGPVLHLRGFALMGGVTVKTKAPERGLAPPSRPSLPPF